MNERLKEFRKSLGLSAMQYAQKLEMTQQSISQMETARYPIKKSTAKLMSAVYNLNEDWLYTGEGEMFNPPALPNPPEYYTDPLMRELLDMNEACLEYMLEQVRALKSKHNWA